ncbi:GNAT family N-acetyltransferase [Thalassotalea hakodatensis]|uniref:GNAT family N-acetyltransferase n=1 Tax=Thalassotalea hakodatensis TaxID=3030492 RepID=UPI003899D09F
MKKSDILIEEDDLTDGQIVSILEEHLKDMFANSPAESVHALDTQALKQPNITFYSFKYSGKTLGCVAIKTHSETVAEIKSMRTINEARGQGVATRLLNYVMNQATIKGYTSLHLETGSMVFFKPARDLYLRHGFTECGPFAGYQSDPNSIFMTHKRSH